jgi:hypothetical protein
MSTNPYDPQFIAQLGSITAIPEQNQAIQQQMALANQLRNPAGMPEEPNMLGKVAVRHGLGGDLIRAAGNFAANQQQAGLLQQQVRNANMLRDVRGRAISEAAARDNLENNPDQNHPDTNAALSQSTDMSDLGGYVP